MLTRLCHMWNILAASLSLEPAFVLLADMTMLTSWFITMPDSIGMILGGA